MTKKNFLCGLISTIFAVTAVNASFVYDVQAVSETIATEESDYSEAEFNPVTASEDAEENIQDIEKLKTSDNDITKQSIITVPETTVSSSSLLNDKNRSTKIKFNAGEQIKISNDKNDICSLYIIWDTPVTEWTLSYGGHTDTYGQNGFIHEYAELVMPAGEVVITLPDTSATICDIYTFSKGDKPSWVQDWNPPCENADMLVLPARGNNEVVDFGGLLPYYALEKGVNVQVAYMVNQWLEYYRPHEILNALWECGVTNYPVFGDFTDCEVNTYEEAQMVYDKDEVTQYVVSLIRRFKPQVVVGQDLNGEGGHAISMVYADAVAEAVKISADSNVYPDSASEYGVWDVPKTYLHLYGNSDDIISQPSVTDYDAEESQEYAETMSADLYHYGAVVTEPAETGEAISTGYNGDVEYLVKPITFDWSQTLSKADGKSAYEVAELAFEAHKSQINWAAMADNGIKSTAVYGLYRTNVGYDKDNDMLENTSVVVMTDEQKIESEADFSSLVSENYKGTKRVSSGIIALSVIFAIAAVGLTVYRIIKKDNNKK